MASSPNWKIYDAAGKYQAACKEPEAAAALVAFYGEGATVRYEHRHKVWREGAETVSAGDSYDEAAETMLERINGGA